MTLTIQEFARLGGKARWKGITKKERSGIMSKLGRLANKKKQERLNGVDKPKLQNKKVIQQVISKKTRQRASTGV